MSKWDDFFVQKFNSAFGRRDAARAALRLVKSNLTTTTPPWARVCEELDAAVEGARADLLRSWNAHQESLKRARAAAQAEADWRRVLGDFRRHVADLNRRIAAHNLTAPAARFRRPPVDAEMEISRVTDGRQ